MKRNNGSPLNGFARVFGWPILIAVLSSFGLIAALIGDDLWDVLSWAALGVSPLVIAWHIMRS